MKFVRFVSYLKSVSHKSETLRLHNYLAQSLKTLEQEKGAP